ncbi:MAG: PKD domain-containing protein [Solirubrobacteraceae bacterium]|nr:PKD domain-containing protein [Solirubrobacteraceae bacterium]
MPFRRRLIALAASATVALLLSTAASAPAALFPGEVVDGPNPGILAVGGADMDAADGAGGVVYLREDGGAPHVFVARIVDGVWQPPERVDGALAPPASDPVIAAGTGGRLVVAWVTEGVLYASVRQSRTSGWSGPQAVGAPATLPAIDMGFNDNAYLVWSTGEDVHAARLPRGATQFQPVAGPLDLDPVRRAGGQPNLRPSVAVSAEGLALAAWGEVGADGRSHVVARRIDGTRPSPVPADLTVDELDGRRGGDADAPMATIQSDSSFGWVVFRQALSDGETTTLRAIGRHMRGSLFEPPVIIDGQGWPAESVGWPSMAIQGTGTGFSAVPLQSGPIFGMAVNSDDEWTPFATRLDSAPVPVAGRLPVFYSEDKNGMVAWPAPDGMLRMRFVTGIAFQPEQQITKPELGPVDWGAGVAMAGDRYLNGFVVAIQGSGAERRLVSAVNDREPGNFSPWSSSRWYREPPARLSWREPKEAWGDLRYTLEIDGRAVGTTRRLSYPTRNLRLRSGVHLWRVLAIDSRGQASATPTRLLKIDRDPPNVTISFRRSGRVATIDVRAIDRDSGSKTPQVFFGDGTSAWGRHLRHAYRPGRYTVTVRASDNVGNVRTERRVLVIR